MALDSLPVVSFDSAAAWESWLEARHASSPGAWLKIAKKNGGRRTITYPEALEGALCFGWIDGQKGALDDEYWLQRFSPRKPRSRWSRINTQKAAELIESGRMRPAGLAEVERAKADGRWAAAYEPQSAITVPDDLAAELAANDQAREFFATLSSVNRYAILYRIAAARQPETRARRIARYVAMLADGQTIHP
jgi:uncharacterized protein YdeI (YjbR/CyaY-like superfamily)